MRTVIALGGNAIAEGGDVTISSQRDRIRETAEPLERLRERGHDLVLTHGNGPQVGQLLAQQEAADAPERPLDVLVAETQGQVGYLIAGCLRERIGGDVATLLTRVAVDPDDPAFDEPTKPVGPYYTESEAAARPFETGPVTTPEGDRAYRRLVPSPRPTAVREAETLGALVDGGTTVVCAGGGGVPVPADGGDADPRTTAGGGVAAVVDKDYTSSLVAEAVGADRLVMVTDVPSVYRDFGTEDQEPIREADASEMRRALAAGEFAEGSMRPKVEACLSFLDAGGDRAVVTASSTLVEAVDGDRGTQIYPESA